MNSIFCPKCGSECTRTYYETDRYGLRSGEKLFYRITQCPNYAESKRFFIFDWGNGHWKSDSRDNEFDTEKYQTMRNWK